MALPGDLWRIVISQLPPTTIERGPTSLLEVWLTVQFPELPAIQQELHEERLTRQQLLQKILAWSGAASYTAQNYLPAEIALLNAICQQQLPVFLDVYLRNEQISSTIATFLLQRAIQSPIAFEMLRYALANGAFFDSSLLVDDITTGDTILTEAVVRAVLLSSSSPARAGLFVGVALAWGLPIAQACLHVAAFTITYREVWTFDVIIGYLLAGGRSLAELGQRLVGLEYQTALFLILAQLNIAKPIPAAYESVALGFLAYHIIEIYPADGTRRWPTTASISYAGTNYANGKIITRDARILRERAALLLPLVQAIYVPSREKTQYLNDLEFILGRHHHTLNSELRLLFGDSHHITGDFLHDRNAYASWPILQSIKPLALAQKLARSLNYGDEALASSREYLCELLQNARQRGQLLTAARHLAPFLQRVRAVAILSSLTIAPLLQLTPLSKFLLELRQYPQYLVVLSSVVELLHAEYLVKTADQKIWRQRLLTDAAHEVLVFRYHGVILLVKCNDYEYEIWRRRGLPLAVRKKPNKLRALTQRLLTHSRECLLNTL